MKTQIPLSPPCHRIFQKVSNKLWQHTAIASLVLLTSVSLNLETAHAQSAVQRAEPLPAFSRSLVSNNDSTALIQNPANLAYLPGFEVRWTGAFLKENADAASQGNAIGLALPFGFIPVSTGIRLDMIDPPAKAASDVYDRAVSYQWLTWALALGSDTAAIGFSYQQSYSDAVEAHNFHSWNLGLNYRPSDFVGLAAVAHNMNAPLSKGGAQLGRSYEFGTAIRPLGTSDVEVSLEASFFDEKNGYWVPRAVLDVGIPTLGRLRTDISVIDPAESAFPSSWLASTSLVVNMNSRHGAGEASIGTRYGSALGDAQSRAYDNIHAEVAFQGFRRSFAADNLPYALRLRIENTPSTRGHVALLRKLWRMAEQEPHLKAVLLEIRATPARSLAHIQELQDAIYHLKNNGKKVLCHLESASGAALYLCSAADKTLMNPAGNIHYSGLKSSGFYFKGLLDKLGVRADFVRIGKHKSAPEALSRTKGTATAIKDRTDLLQQVELELSSSIARGRNLEVADLRKSVARGPFTAVEAKQAGLVDGFAFDDMLEEKTREMAGPELVFQTGERAKTEKKRFGPAQRMAIVYVDGNMVDGRSQTFPFIGIHTAGSYTIAESLKQVREDPSISAVVLRVETGGGSAMAADVIWREVQLTATKKPVIVSMGSAAASGGYYVAAPGSYVYANPLTITGSIGIFYGKMDIAGMLSKIGVNVETLRTSTRADAESAFRPFTDDERKELKKKIQQFYGLFLTRVAAGRGLTKKQVDAVGRGRVWTGRQAKEHHLVDELGGLRQALAKARIMGRLRDDATIIELPVQKTSLLGKLIGVEGIKSELRNSVTPLPPEFMKVAQAIAPYALYPSSQALARIEFLPDLLP